MNFIAILAFWSLNYIAAEIEHPFGEDLNDLPVADMLKDMNRSLRALLLEQTQNPPKFTPPRGSLSYRVSMRACNVAGYVSSTKELVTGFAKSRSRTLQLLHQNSSSKIGGLHI